ncbi:cation:proton antiporter [Stygiolobus azoricus]|uniref:cation:proton antiporter n=1 Tax=Stygiolobus azoricus TaxID=41675 RepID=UPI0018C8A40E|nr:cation:proton antiporter [Stygiolobus azoricus]
MIQGTNTILTLTLVIATFSGLVLRRLRISPVLAYLVSGLIGELLGLNYNNPEFQFISFLAVNLLSFEMGVSVNLVDLKKMFRRALFIVIIEFLFVYIVISIISLAIKLSLIQTFLLAIIGFNTSTSIAFKLGEGKLDENDFKLILSVASLEDTLAFVALGIITSGDVNIFNLLITSLSSLALGYIVSKVLINPTLQYAKSEESVILSSVASVFLFNLLSSILSLPSTLANFLLGIGTSYASTDPEKIIRYMKPLVDFTLIFFFFIAGSYLKISGFILYYILISVILVLTKLFAFSTAYWFSGVDFLRAYGTGLFMTSLSEFGIVISLTALQLGLPVATIYNISTVLVAVSSTIASVLTSRNQIVLKTISKMYLRLRLDRFDSLIKNLGHITFKSPEILTSFLKFSILSVTLTFSSIYLADLIATLSPYLALFSLSLIVLTPFLLILFILYYTRKTQNQEFRPIIQIFMWGIFLLIMINYTVLLARIIAASPLLDIIISILVSTLIAIFFYSKIYKLIEELDKLF